MKKTTLIPKGWLIVLGYLLSVSLVFSWTYNSEISISTNYPERLAIAYSCGSTIIHSADFESGLDGWTSGGSDASRENNTTWSYSGDYSLRIRDDDASGSTSSFDSPAFDLSSYDKVDFKFFFAPDSVEDTEEFMIEYSSDNGSTWTTVKVFEGGSVGDESADFETTSSVIFYGKIVTLKSTDYTFPSSTISKFRIRCNASNNDDKVFIDNITICLLYTSPSPRDA